MRFSKVSRAGLVAALAGFLGLTVVTTARAEPPAAPKVSTFAQADELIAQVDSYLDRLTEATASETQYKEDAGKVAKDGNTLALLAVALGVHDTDNKYKPAAAALLKAAQGIAAAKDYAAAKAGVDAAKKAVAAPAGGADSVKWEKVASLKELMEQVPLINSRLKRNLKKFSTRAKDSLGDTATLAVIAQGSMANAGDTAKPTETAKWYTFCAAMRDAASAMNAAIKAKDEKAAEKTLKALTQSCDDCHAVFHAEALEK
jgi:hypothetical protein